MRNFTIVDWFGYNLLPQERMRLIKDANFTGVMLLCTNQFDSDYKSFPDYARKVDLFVENAHAPYLDANSLWIDNLDGQNYLQKIVECIKDCSTYDISTLVIHPTNGNIPLPINDIGIERIKRIIEKAEQLDVNVAFENMESPEYLEYIFDKIQSKRLGFCFDSGHCNLYSPKLDLLSLHGDKLMALHIHDNDSKEDQHALPYTGNVNWTEFAVKLQKINYKGAIALEVRNTGYEHIKNPSDFLNIAFERAIKIIR
jgi:L-ribulose-5-phosphate 3-epimerase